MLYGQYMVIDSIKDWRIFHRLRGVDRYRAALVMGLLSADPRGIDPTRLLRHGEDPRSFREVLAWLIACEWVDISADGRNLNFISPAKRALRHPT